MARHQRESNGHGQTLRQKSTSHNSSQLRRFHERVSNTERKLSQSWWSFISTLYYYLSTFQPSWHHALATLICFEFWSRFTSLLSEYISTMHWPCEFVSYFSPPVLQRPPASHELFLWTLYSVPVSTAGPRAMARSQAVYSDPVGADTLPPEDSTR